MSKGAVLQHAVVMDRDDPLALGRMRVQLDTSEVEWLEVVGWGTGGAPEIGSPVLVLRDHTRAYVVGSIGARLTADALSGDGQAVDTLHSRRLRVLDRNGAEQMVIELPAGTRVEWDESVPVQPSQELRLHASQTVVLQAASVTVSAEKVRITAPMVDCSGVVKCDTLIASSVVSASYTPGSGNER